MPRSTRTAARTGRAIDWKRRSESDPDDDRQLSRGAYEVADKRRGWLRADDAKVENREVRPALPKMALRPRLRVSPQPVDAEPSAGDQATKDGAGSPRTERCSGEDGERDPGRLASAWLLRSIGSEETTRLARKIAARAWSQFMPTQRPVSTWQRSCTFCPGRGLSKLAPSRSAHALWSDGRGVQGGEGLPHRSSGPFP